jgi:hypothetical protein
MGKNLYRVAAVWVDARGGGSLLAGPPPLSTESRNYPRLSANQNAAEPHPLVYKYRKYS